MSTGLSFSGVPIAFVLLPAPCLPFCLGVARYAFDNGDSQSARQQNEIALVSNDRLGLKPSGEARSSMRHSPANGRGATAQSASTTVPRTKECPSADTGAPPGGHSFAPKGAQAYSPRGVLAASGPASGTLARPVRQRGPAAGTP